MWALGVVLYCLLYGQFPFYHQVPAELFRMIRDVEYRFPTNVSVSEVTKEIIRRLLTADLKKRFDSSIQ